MTSLLKRLSRSLLGDIQPVDTSWLKMPSSRKKGQLTERDLIHQESLIGGQIFGDIAKGHRREFFCLDKNTWIWHEEWLDENRKPQSQTTRYEIQESGILKVQSGPRYTYIEGQELENFYQAVKTYYERVSREVYHTEPKPLSV